MRPRSKYQQSLLTRFRGYRSRYLRVGNPVSWDDAEELLSIRRRHRRRIRLSALVLVCIGIIAYPSDHQTGKIVHETSRLHLKV